MLPKLGAACRDVQARLDTERTQLESNRPQFLQSPVANSDTAVGKLLKTLTHESSIERLESLASLTDGDRQRLQQLSVLLANDGRKHGQELRNRARRLLALKETLTKGMAALSPAALARLETI